MKKSLFILSFLLCFILSFQFFSPAYASVSSNVDVKINENYVKFDISPFIVKSVTYVPVRFFADAVGASVTWNENTENAVIEKNGILVNVIPKEDKAFVDGVLKKTGGTVIHEEGRIFVPVRFLSESLGGYVRWDNYYRNVCVDFENVTVNGSMIDYSYTDDDVFWLGRIIEAESSGEPLKGKIAVGNVVLNRVKSNEFPNTIYGVIFDRNHGVQFQPIINGAIYNKPSYESMLASKSALKGERPVGDSLYFLNPHTASNFWIVDNREYHTTILNHDFYL